ncbi:MAG: cation:proton antiporter [Vicinamibacterales bacterium]
MHNLDLILTLTGGLSAALLLGYLTHRLGMSPIVGYLLGGTLLGPHTPGFVANTHLAEEMAEIGVILLMFGVGLQFHLKELLAVRRVAVPGAILHSLVAAALGYGIGIAAGWSWQGALIFGVALSVASTVVLIRVLADQRDLHTQTGHIAVGMVVVEDLFTVAALVILPTLLGPATSAAHIGAMLGVTAAKVIALLGFTALVGTRVIPFLLDRVAATRSRELFTLTVLVIALGIAVGSSLVFDVSMALGAFLAGMVVGRSEYSLRAASDALPMRDAFAVLFFVSVGMLLDPLALLDAPWVFLATFAVVVIGKSAVALVIMRVMRYPFRVALGVSVALSQIGEFTFILSTLGKSLGVLTADATNALVGVSILSIVVNPLLYRSVPAIERWARTRPRLWRILNPSDDAEPAADARPRADDRPGAVVIGYGPTGRTVVRLLRGNTIEPAVVEMNMDTVRELRSQGLTAVYGDASHPDTLSSAGAAHARVLILTSPDITNAAEVIRAARELNPKIRVLARTAYLRDIDALKAAGADEVFSGEGEVAFAFADTILRGLGATPEQIDRERARVHADLFGAREP